MGTTAEKLTYLNTTKQLIKESINLTDANITTQPFRQYATILKHRLPEIVGDPSIIWNNYEHVTGSGTSFSITAYNSIIDYSLKGNTTQNGTPTPDAPVPVNVVSGDNTINICGKNLANPSDIYDGYPTGNNGGTIGFNPSANSITYKKCAYVVAGQPYTLSWKINTIKAAESRDIKIVDNNNIILENFSYSNANNNRTRTFTPTYSGWVYAALDTNATEVQIEKGADTTYEPYQGNTYNIDLPSGMELCKIGTYQDYIYKDSGKWYLHKEIGKYNFTGNETISLQNNGRRIFINTITSSIPEPLHTTSISQKFGMYSNKLVEVTAGNTWNGIQGVSYDYDVGQNKGNFDISINGISTLEEYKTAIVGIELVYILQTPTNTEITDATLIEQLNDVSLLTGLNNISVSGDLPATLDLTALKYE